MIGLYDLYDISAALTRIREDIYYDKNSLILHKIKEVVVASESYNSNCIRKVIASIPDLDQEKWFYVYHENVYVYDIILKNQVVVNLLNKALEELIMVLEDGNYDRANDLTDAIHCLPNIIAENHFSVTKSYWQSHVIYYRKRWNKSFLMKEQKILC